jgi:hypothetical protein
MKKMTLLALSILTTQAFAATTSTTDLSKSSSKKSKNIDLLLETETMTVRDDNNDINGVETFYKVEPSFKVGSKAKIAIGAQYNERSLDGDKIRSYGVSDYKNDKSKNHDALNEVYLKLNYKTAKYKKNGIADLKLNARIYSNEDSFFQKYYGNNGNYQLRAYFGRPVNGKLFINKYTSYVRYKKYFTNSDSGSRSRDYELRARISPTYAMGNGLEIGTTFTYNHIFQLGAGYSDDAENITLDLSARYQIKNYAVMLRAGITALDNSKNGVLTTTEDNMDQVGYALNFTAYL